MFADKHVTRCPLALSRRTFLRGLGGSALAMKMGLFDFASSLLGAAPQPPGTCRIMGAFARPDVDRYWLGWPGTAYDIKGHQEMYTKVMTLAAERLGVTLDLLQTPLFDEKSVNAYLEKVAETKPDGVLLTCMALHPDGWRATNQFLDKRGSVPTVVFSPMGTSFTGHLQHSRKSNNAFVGATQDVEWLAMAVRMLKTVWEMKQTRICIVRGNKTEDRLLDVIGTTLHYIPGKRFLDEFEKVEASDEVRAMADHYTKEAKKIVEPSKDDILTAAKNYIVCRRLMETEKCHGFSMDCLGPIGRREIKPPCLAFMRLRDEGIVGACEADPNACISSRLTHLLFERPGFMQDPAPNTVNNTLMAAHCTCGAHLDGFDKPHEPFILRSHSESDLGVAIQVLWRVGQKITLMKFQGPQKIILGTGSVLRNIDTPPSGGCRTSLECTVDGVADSRDVKGFHQLLIYGDLEDEFKAYCQLAGIGVEHI
ncbi:MAG: hypothetical protein AMS14_06820 [Planctomycetes bacterium DG_20]|nr:MAG: hypothetical protein AMS14_06820 [Planctomycetes bacterium DG_20]